MTDFDETTEGDGRMRAGFAALIGAPNAGKSTLMNAMVGSKVSIVTPKVQTTRSRVRGIAMHGKSQIVFIDTPGIFQPKGDSIAQWFRQRGKGLKMGMSCYCFMIVHAAKLIRIRLPSWASLPVQGVEVSLVLNKIDLAPQERLLSRADELSKMYDFERIFMISAETGNGVNDLKSWLADHMPPGPYLFDPDDLSDMPMRLLAAEIMREKLFLNLHQELPYQLTVETEKWEEYGWQRSCAPDYLCCP